MNCKQVKVSLPLFDTPVEPIFNAFTGVPDAKEVQKMIETGEVTPETKTRIEEGKKLLKGLFGD